MTAHRLRGHVPYEPSCETCQACKGVHRHARKRTDRGLDVLVTADFAFVNRDGEAFTEESSEESQRLKFLVLKESFSSSIGIVMCSGNQQKDQQLLEKILLSSDYRLVPFQLNCKQMQKLQLHG